MSRRTHLWLLHRGAPAAPTSARVWLRHLLADRGWAGGAMPWYLPWLGAWAARAWERRLLPGPAPTPGPVDQAARKLFQILGDGWMTRAVASFGEADAATAAGEVADGDQALLLSLLPHRSAARDAQIAAARAALANRRVAIEVLSPLSESPAFIEASAEAVRAALADLPAGARYAVLFYAPALADAPGASLRDELEQHREAVVRAIGLRRPHHLGWIRGPGAWARPGASLQRAARDAIAGGADHIVLAPLAQTVAWPEVNRALAELGARAPTVRWSEAEPVALRPTLLRDIAERAAASREGTAPRPRAN